LLKVYLVGSQVRVESQRSRIPDLQLQYTSVAPAHEHQVALPWLARLRWIAVLGQVIATSISVWWLQLTLPLAWIALVISITAISNLPLHIWDRARPAQRWLAPGVILLDVFLFTILLYLTGGPDNPFCVLYAIHVAMAVAVLGGAWAWVVVAQSVVCYGVIFFWHRPLPLSHRLTDRVIDFGNWCALVLVMLLIAYFIGRILRSLRQREQELADAREQSSRSEHLVALTTLAAGAAHELGTPLGTIALAAKEMEKGEDPAALAEDARLIREQVERCRQILDRMRVDVIEDGSVRPAFENLGELLEELQNDLRPEERSQLLIKTTEPSDELLARTRVLRRILGVLLRNAFDASPPNQNVELLFRRGEGRMIFTVQDHGPGMSEQVLRRAGQPFFTTKAPGSGMGLGLFLVRLAAETYGGSFKLESSPGEGTRSIFELPDRPAEDIAHDAAQLKPEAPDAGGGRRHDVPHAPDQGAIQQGL
jgi:two-component system sensor histidine kinase RegB